MTLGKRVQERIAQAAQRPTHPPEKPELGEVHNEGDRWWKRSEVGWDVFHPTQDDIYSYRLRLEAERADSFDRVVQALKRSLEKAFREPPWASDRMRVKEITLDLEVFVYHVVLVVGGQLNDPTYEFDLPDEVLTQHTSKVEDYQRFIRSIAEGVHRQITEDVQADLPPWKVSPPLKKKPKIKGLGSTYEATFSPSRTAIGETRWARNQRQTAAIRQKEKAKLEAEKAEQEALEIVRKALLDG